MMATIRLASVIFRPEICTMAIAFTPVVAQPALLEVVLGGLVQGQDRQGARSQVSMRLEQTGFVILAETRDIGGEGALDVIHAHFQVPPLVNCDEYLLQVWLHLINETNDTQTVAGYLRQSGRPQVSEAAQASPPSLSD